MKKNVFAYLIAASSVFAINNVLAADGTIDFTGEITDQACELATGSDAFTVNLGKISKTALPSTGSTAAATKFTIKLENCPQTVTSATVKFDATSYAGDSSVLQLTDPTAATTAKNVGIQIQDVTGTTVPLFTESSAYALKEKTVNNLDFTARYIAMSDSVGVGQANSTATFTINYN
ncbi:MULTISPECIES: fimbrial protein [Providencia]|uniref:fimbrial protein n=1 Tax=Providencia TaxID=586 RepID=UPI00109CDF0D|nr:MULTISPECIES: fimbrial protein [Providencia]QNP21454.1 fimbrial protein [Providencia rettgeri]THB29365.1 type 1 fimbrial protein [Providencia sp. MGF014]